MVAAAMIDDGLLTALHAACERPLPGATCRGVAAGSDLLCVYEPEFDGPALDRLLTGAAARVGGAPAFVVAREVRLDAMPVGRFVLRADRPARASALRR
jgi:hypothetical protein